jgi:group I intron endonuclease
MHIGYIYKTTNLVNDRCYIGKKNKSEFDSSYYGSGIALQSAINKYGKQNFIVEVLHWATTVEELNQLEITAIAEHKSINNTYNIAAGGDGGDTTSSHPNKKAVIKKRGDGIKSWHSSLTEEAKIERGKKISAAKKGKSNGHEGLVHSDITKQKMSNANKSYTKTDAWKLAHQNAMSKKKGKPFTQKYKPVIINDIEYPSIKDALVSLKITKTTYYRWIKENKLQVIYK